LLLAEEVSKRRLRGQAKKIGIRSECRPDWLRDQRVSLSWRFQQQQQQVDFTCHYMSLT
jgi:histone acetyltransferase (RNA polymerase elongator complex component)